MVADTNDDNMGELRTTAKREWLWLRAMRVPKHAQVNAQTTKTKGANSHENTTRGMGLLQWPGRAGRLAVAYHKSNNLDHNYYTNLNNYYQILLNHLTINSEYKIQNKDINKDINKHQSSI